MRSLSSSGSLRGKLWSSLTSTTPSTTTIISSTVCARRSALLQNDAHSITQRRSLAKAAEVQPLLATNVAFHGDAPFRAPEGPGHFFDHKPVDQRKLKLGKTIRTLRERLPTLLATPLPQELLSPQITLRLFPSTHPHLPSVTGRIAYTAALWTSPVAWGRVPVVGNVKLVILSERMVSSGLSDASSASVGGEKLIVKWKTCGAGKGDVTEQIKKMMAILGRNKSGDKNEDFHGLFLFEFDEEGRILSHTIEHVEEGNNWERMAKVISVTDWLLGRAWAKKQEPAIAMCHDQMSRVEKARRS